MRISAIEFAGFRGARDPVRIDIPAGFAILTGRNGAGKSTVCDAIEFAFTGTISKYADAQESKESVEDYFWWRGVTPAADRSVTVSLTNSHGDTFNVTRDGNGKMAVNGGTEAGALERILCDPTTAPPGALAQLCRTSIIRDELIARFSVDQDETHRFAFVKAALGSDVLDRVEKHGKRLGKLLDDRAAVLEKEYLLARQVVTELVSQLSRARLVVEKAADVRAAEAQLEVAIGEAATDLGGLQALARREVSNGRLSADRLEAQLASLTSIQRELHAVDATSAAAERERLGVRLAELEQRVAALRQRVHFAQEQIAALEGGRTAVADALATLLECGQRVGLIDGHCPLCASELDSQRFEQQLAKLAAQIEGDAKDMARRQLDVKEAVVELTAAEEQLLKLSRERDQRSRDIADLEDRIRNATRNFVTLGIDVPQDVRAWLRSGVALNTVREMADASRERAYAIESALSVVEASTAVEQVGELEQRIAGAQLASADTERRWAESKSAATRARAGLAGIRRGVNEFVEERLAALAPLLQDLYARLKPHVDWQEVHYILRGDVRRFLSLRVGDNMNPRFMFSSGQRRAAGMAFLLAVHMSRPWCLLDSLILDDPVQHIDDFRALHLVEVLAGVRRAGRQVICAVEDPALAKLMARRLRGDERSEGAIIEMAYAAGDGIEVVRNERVMSSQTPLLQLA